MWTRRASFLWLALAWGASLGQTAKDYAGTWVLPLQGKNLMVLRLEPGSGATPMAGSLARPMRFTSDGEYVSAIARESVTEPIVSSSWQKGALVITVEKPNDPSDKDAYRVLLTADGHLSLRSDGVSTTPWLFSRAGHDTALAADWDSTRSYALDDDGVSNPEMTKIFEADQKARDGDMAKIDWSVVGREDEHRRLAVRELLKQGELHTGDDFEHAAFLFQHGGTPDDYLLAHTLAMLAVARGRSSAIWIAAATLDRYLQNIKQPQIYGTQFKWDNNGPTTQEPYHRELISDALRRALGVPPMTQQEEKRKEIDASRHLPTPNSPDGSKQP